MRWVWASIVATGLACGAVVSNAQENPPAPDATQGAEAKPRAPDAEPNSQTQPAGKDAPATAGAAAQDSKAESVPGQQDQSGSNANQPTSVPGQETKASPENAEATTAKDAAKGAAKNPRPTGSATAAATPRRPHKIVVRAGGASEPETHIVAGMTVEEANSQRKEAEKYLGAAEENLKRLVGRVLDTQQQERIYQIHNYLGRARSALDEGDVSRGHTLAMKANLLAEDLVKH